MSEPVKMHTSLPGMPDVRIWLDIDWIVVKYGEIITYKYAHYIGAEEREQMRDALAEATA